ncbi:hypothetical protein ACHAQH_006764 [Verticillium albo-atrum]
MRPLIPLLVCGILPAIKAVRFTSPDPKNEIDLSQPVEITWDLNSQFGEPLARGFHLWFYALMGGGQVGWEIQRNLSYSSGSFTWDPSSIVDGIASEGNTLSPDKEHFFSARIVGADGSRLATLESERYALEGYDFIRNGGAHVRVEAAVVGVVAGLAVVGAALL